MLIFFLIVLSIWFNHIWLMNNENFILAVFLSVFFLSIYLFVGYIIKLYFFLNANRVLNLLKYSNSINNYLNKIVYYNIYIRNLLLNKLFSSKNKLVIILNLLNNKINKFLLFNILNFFLTLKKNLFKIQKNKNLLILKSNLKKCEIIL